MAIEHLRELKHGQSATEIEIISIFNLCWEVLNKNILPYLGYFPDHRDCFCLKNINIYYPKSIYIHIFFNWLHGFFFLFFSAFLNEIPFSPIGIIEKQNLYDYLFSVFNDIWQYKNINIYYLKMIIFRKSFNAFVRGFRLSSQCLY